MVAHLQTSSNINLHDGCHQLMQIMHFVVTGKGPLRSSFQDKLAAAPLLHIQVSPLPKSATYPPALTSQASLPLPYLLRLLSMHARVCLTEDVRAKRLLSIIARVCLCHLSHICLCHLSDIARHMNPWPSHLVARARAHTHTCLLYTSPSPRD